MEGSKGDTLRKERKERRREDEREMEEGQRISHIIIVSRIVRKNYIKSVLCINIILI